MAEWSCEDIWRRAQDAENKRSTTYGWIDQCLRYAMPWRRRGARPGDLDTLFDSTALTGVQRFANKLQRDFTPPFQRWMELKAGPMVPTELHDDVNRELETASQIVLAVLDASAFGKASHEAYGDLSVGTMALLFAEGDDFTPVRVTACAAWQLGIEEGPDGTVQNVYYDAEFPAWMLSQKWPKAEWPADVRQLISDRKTDMIRILQASYYDDDTRGWRLVVMCRPGCGEQAIVHQTERRANPWVVSRWWTSPGNPWGWGPLMSALPDIRTANKTVEFVLRAAAYQLAPPLMVLHDGIVNPDRMRVAPSALIQVARTGGPMGASIAPLDIGARTDLSQIVLTDERDAIKKALMDQGLPPDSGAVRSAAEIIGRQKELSYDGGAAFGRLNQECVPGVVAAVIDILDKKKVSVISWNRLRIDQLQLRVNVISPLARAQNLDDAQQIIQAAQTIGALFGPEAVIHALAVENLPAHLAGLLGVSPSMIRSAKERAALAKMAGQVAADQQNRGAQDGAASVGPPAGGLQGAAAPAPYATPQPGATIQ